MNSVHDMGGMDGFGRVEPEANEPVFHTPWEGRVLAMQRAMGFLRVWTIDQSRATLEALPPVTYLSASYYEKWLLGLGRRVVDYGLVGADEIAAGHSLRPSVPLNRKLLPADADNLNRGNFWRLATAPARFNPGDRVRTLPMQWREQERGVGPN